MSAVALATFLALAPTSCPSGQYRATISLDNLFNRASNAPAPAAPEAVAADPELEDKLRRFRKGALRVETRTVDATMGTGTRVGLPDPIRPVMAYRDDGCVLTDAEMGDLTQNVDLREAVTLTPWEVPTAIGLTLGVWGGTAVALGGLTLMGFGLGSELGRQRQELDRFSLPGMAVGAVAGALLAVPLHVGGLALLSWLTARRYEQVDSSYDLIVANHNLRLAQHIGLTVDQVPQDYLIASVPE